MWISYKDKEAKYKFIREIKKRINFNTGDIIILFVGRPNKRKGFNDILEIWDRFFKNKSNFKLILLGINQNDILKTKKELLIIFFQWD